MFTSGTISNGNEATAIMFNGVGDAITVSTYIGVSQVNGTTGAVTGWPLTPNPYGEVSLGLGAAMDIDGNVWMAADSAPKVMEVSQTGALLFPANGIYNGATSGLNEPGSVAIDHEGNVWASNSGNYGIAEFSSAGVLLSPPGNPTPGFAPDVYPSSFYGLAIDGADHVFIGAIAHYVSELNSDGSYTQGIQPLSDASLTFTYGIAIDGSGNLWVANNNSSVTQFVGAAVPVVTPIAAGVANNTLGTRP